MKSSPFSLRAVVLTLFMIILVLLSLFWFLYRGWGPLEEQAQARATRIGQLEEEVAQQFNSLQIGQATQTAVAQELQTAVVAQTTATAELAQLRESNQQLAAQATAVSQQPANGATTPEAVQPGAPGEPQVAIVAPAADAVLPLNEPVSFLAVAADASGLAMMMLARDGQVVTQTVPAGATWAEMRSTWIPTAVGVYTVVVTAVNSAQIASQPFSMTLQVADLDQEMVEFQQMIAAITGAPALAEPDMLVPTALPVDEAANLRFLQLFDFLPAGEVTNVGLLGEYCQLTAVSPPPDPLASASARLAYIRSVVRQQQLESHDLANLATTLSSDEERAALCALAEGQIRLAQERYITQLDPDMQPELWTNLDDHLRLMPGAAPPIINEQQLFPTAEGLAFVRQLYDLNGDFSQVNAAWAQPPQTTQHILHPDLYLAGAAPVVTTTISSLDDLLSPDWALSGTGSMGEWMLGRYLRQELETETAVDTAVGWAGDSYAIYYQPTNSDNLLLAWQIAWQTPEAQQTFIDNYDRYLTALLGTPGLQQAGADNSRCWEGRLETFCLYPATPQGELITVAVRVPAADKTLAQELINAIVAEAAADS